jgi:hypothetical protein
MVIADLLVYGDEKRGPKVAIMALGSQADSFSSSFY